MPNDPVLILFGLGLFWLVASTVIGAFILRATVSLYNKLAVKPSSPEAVPEPKMGAAMAITFLSAVLNFIVGMFINVAVSGIMNALHGASQAVGAKPLQPGFKTMILAYLVSIPVMAAVAMGLLPTKYSRALVVSVLYNVITIVAVVIITVIGMALLGR